MFDDYCRAALKDGYDLNLEETRIQYNQLGAKILLGIGLIGLIALLFQPDFSHRLLLFLFVLYCLYLPLHTFLFPPGFPLWFSMLQVPVGLSLVVLVQYLVPVDLVPRTGFLFPISFIFTFHFHARWYFVSLSLIVFAATTAIVMFRDVPYWESYLIATVGSTLTIGILVHTTVSKALNLANYDSLTGLMNRRHWEERVTHLIAMAKREAKPLSIVFIDLDNFKEINDTQGHSAGDAVLIKVGQKMQDIAREADSLARWGGDEFAIALPNTRHDQATAMVHRLQDEIDGIEASCGVVELLENEQLEPLLMRADQLMYQVKHAKQVDTQRARTA